MRRMRCDRAGATSVEFALVASGFVLLLIGGLQIGLLWWTENAMQITAALTARCAALGSCTDPASYAASLAGDWTAPGAVTAADVTVSAAASSSCHGASGGYGRFTMVTITSEPWSGVLVGPLSGKRLTVSACYPSPS